MRDKFIFSQRLIQEIKKSGKSINCIERELGYPRNAIQNYKNGRNPSGNRLLELSRYFHVTPEYLIGIEEEKYSKSLIQSFEDLDYNQKLGIYQLSQIWAYHQLMIRNQL